MSFSASPEICIRRPRPADAPFVAAMVQLSMGTLADHLFEVDRSSILTILEKLFLQDAGRFGCGIVFVAAAGECSMGALVACEGARLNDLNLGTMPCLFSVMGVRHALAFIRRAIKLPGGREAERDEYYISNLGVEPSVQGRGIGSQLIAFAEHSAKIKKLKKCALIVGFYNRDAMRLYQRLGYRIVETVQDENKALGYHRMVKVLGQQ